MDENEGETLLLSPKRAAKLAGVSLDAMHDLLASGELPTVWVGSRRKVPRAALEAWAGVDEPWGGPEGRAEVERGCTRLPGHGGAHRRSARTVVLCDGVTADGRGCTRRARHFGQCEHRGMRPRCGEPVESPEGAVEAHIKKMQTPTLLAVQAEHNRTVSDILDVIAHDATPPEPEGDARPPAQRLVTPAELKEGWVEWNDGTPVHREYAVLRKLASGDFMVSEPVWPAEGAEPKP